MEKSNYILMSTNLLRGVLDLYKAEINFLMTNIETDKRVKSATHCNGQSIYDRYKSIETSLKSDALYCENNRNHSALNPYYDKVFCPTILRAVKILDEANIQNPDADAIYSTLNALIKLVHPYKSYR